MTASNIQANIIAEQQKIKELLVKLTELAERKFDLTYEDIDGHTLNTLRCTQNTLANAYQLWGSLDA